jgi:hypothetical protein
VGRKLALSLNSPEPAINLNVVQDQLTKRAKPRQIDAPHKFQSYYQLDTMINR